jgi:hypothetical protein
MGLGAGMAGEEGIDFSSSSPEEWTVFVVSVAIVIAERCLNLWNAAVQYDSCDNHCEIDQMLGNTGCKSSRQKTQ